MAGDRSNRDYDSAAIEDLLSHPVRREIVETLQRNDGEGVQYLSILVTRKEAERRGDPITSIGFDRMREEIETEHLPALLDAGVIRYNQQTEWVEVDGAPTEFIESGLEEED